ncbi:MAG: LacI family DNA-binding transcriptional regulator [Propionicimonas sp.]
MTKRVKLADVAKLSGVSPTTVSMVLNDRPNTRLSEETAERVRAAAAQLNYRPNPSARGLRVGKTATVGFISDEVTITRFASAMIRGLLDVAEQREHTVLISESGRRPDRIGQALDVMLDRRPDGIVFGLMGAKQIEVPKVPSDIPVVLLNSTSTQGHPYVLPDEYQAGQQAARVLLDQGHRRIALIGRSADLLKPELSVTVGARYAGIDDALAEFGVELVGQIEGLVWEPDLGFDGVHQLLDGGASFTGLICLNDRLAFGAYQALQERGLKVPQDVSVVSFDDEDLASYLRPKLTTMRIPYLEMGRRAMELVLGDERPAQSLIPMALQNRGSVRPLE